MRRSISRAAAGAFLALATASFADGPMTVDEAVEEALASHPALKAATARVEQAEAAHRAVWDAYVPQVSGLAGLQQNQVSGTTTTTTSGGVLGGSETITQDFDESDTRFVAGLGVDQLLFDFGSFSGQRRSTDAATRAQLGSLETQRLEITRNVKVAYYDLLRANRLLQYNQDTVERRERRAQEIAELVRRGRRGRKDLLQAQLDLANARLNYARSRGEIIDVEATFLDAMGQRTRFDRKLVDDVSLKAVAVTIAQATERGLTLRPELDQLRASIESQEAQADAVRSSYLPRVSAFANLTSLTPTGSSSLDQLTVFTGGLSASLPVGWVFQRGRLEQAEAALAELRARELEVRQQIALDVSRSYTALFEAVERTRITRQLADDALASFQETQRLYRARRASISESTDAYMFLYDSRVSLIQALYDAKIAEVRLERAIGAPL